MEMRICYYFKGSYFKKQKKLQAKTCHSFLEHMPHLGEQSACTLRQSRNPFTTMTIITEYAIDIEEEWPTDSDNKDNSDAIRETAAVERWQVVMTYIEIYNISVKCLE